MSSNAPPATTRPPLHYDPAASFSLVHVPHPAWPLPAPDKPVHVSSSPSPPTVISVLDSSFNPPHLAHRALALHSSSSAPHPTARLLLLSSSNVDKGSTAQQELEVRLEMVVALARRLNEDGENTAVATVKEPTFVGKARVLQEALGNGTEAGQLHFEFLVGWDTVTRFFAPRYYTDMSSALETFFVANRSRVLCARRGDIDTAEEQAFLESEEVKLWVEKGLVECFDIDEEELRGISSTKVREAVRSGSWEEVEKMIGVQEVVEVIRRETLYK